jgi:hypothetical protein
MHTPSILRSSRGILSVKSREQERRSTVLPLNRWFSLKQWLTFDERRWPVPYLSCRSLTIRSTTFLRCPGTAGCSSS